MLVDGLGCFECISHITTTENSKASCTSFPGEGNRQYGLKCVLDGGEVEKKLLGRCPIRGQEDAMFDIST